MELRQNDHVPPAQDEKSEEEYDDEFVEEDSYELDSFEQTMPKSKQETIADV